MYDETHTGTGRKILETKFAYEVKNEYNICQRERERGKYQIFKSYYQHFSYSSRCRVRVYTVSPKFVNEKKREEGG